MSLLSLYLDAGGTEIKEIFELSQLEENKPIYIGDKQERLSLIHI